MSSELCECPVCLEEIGDNNRITTRCGHTFHASCIIQNLHTSPLCPMCRTVLDDSPNAQNQLEDLDDETLDTLVESILIGTRSNHRITNNIMIYVDNYLNGSIPNNRDGLRTSIASTIGDYANEFAFDYTHMLRDWASESLFNSEIPEPPPPPPPPVEIPLNDGEEDENGDEEFVNEEYPLGDWEILQNASTNACGDAASGDPDAIALRENVALIRQGLIYGFIEESQLTFLGDREPIYETPPWREVATRSNARIRNLLYPNRTDDDLSDPHGLNPLNTQATNPLINALDNYAIQNNVEIPNNDYNINQFNLDNHIYNQIELISNTIPINSPGLTLQQVENLLME